jgi:UDP-glucose:(heptosyl)LPS alpha-1,3-glucosyltransferase
MRLALVHMRHARSGGTERYLNQLAAFLAERGHEVTIVCRSHVEAPRANVRFEVLRPLSIGGAWRMWAFARAVESFVAARAAEFDLVVGLGKTWSHDVMRLGGGVQRTYLERAHDATLVGWKKLVGRGALKQRIACAVEDRALKRGAARKWICNSAMVRADVLARFDLPPDDVAVVHNGVELERFHPDLRATAGGALRRELGLEPEQSVFLFLGTGYGRKGLSELLASFARVHRERLHTRLVVVGFDSAQKRYEALAGELGVAGACCFLGGRADVAACYAASDVYVLPTLYDPFANTTLEALASGLPVITTATNGAAELIESGREGEVLAERRDPNELDAALIRWTERERIEAARAPRVRSRTNTRSSARCSRRSPCSTRRGALELDDPPSGRSARSKRIRCRSESQLCA